MNMTLGIIQKAIRHKFSELNKIYLSEDRLKELSWINSNWTIKESIDYMANRMT